MGAWGAGTGQLVGLHRSVKSGGEVDSEVRGRTLGALNRWSLVVPSSSTSLGLQGWLFFEGFEPFSFLDLTLLELALLLMSF